MKKSIISLITTFGLIGAAQASEHAYLYKDPRIMAMGGANVAAGGFSGSLFSNPAGLINLPDHHGMVVELLGLGVSASDKSKDIVEDINDAIDTDESDELIKVFEKYSGEAVHIDVSNYSSVSMNHGDIAWSIGLLTVADINFVPHANGGVSGFLETQSRAYGGLTTGYAQTLENIGNGDLTLGVGAKIIRQRSYEGTLSTEDLINADDLGDELRDRFEKDGTGFGVDLGAIYKFYALPSLKPSIGLSVLNIGNMKFDNSYGRQPVTVNIGAAIEPELPYLRKTRVAIDYMDLFNANETRIYNLNGDSGEVTYSDYDDTDFMKRLRLGASAQVYDNSWSSLDLAAGVYQGNLTAGIDFTASVFRLGFSTYAEQIGPEYNDYTDRRYNVTLGIVW